MTETTSPTVLVLRTVNADGTSYNGFQWPLEVGAVAECPDWDPAPKCGNGLHGLVLLDPRRPGADPACADRRGRRAAVQL